MKNFIPVLGLLIAMVAHAAPIFSVEAQKQKKYAEQGVVEIGGSVNFFYSNYLATSNNPGYTEAQAHLFPSIRYYFLKAFHIGGGPGLSFTYWAYDYGNPSVRRVLSIAPSLTTGYTTPITDTLYFDVAVGAGFSYIMASNFLSEGFNERLSLALLPGFKWNIGQGLIFGGLSLSYTQNAQTGFERLQIGFGTGFSVYF